MVRGAAHPLKKWRGRYNHTTQLALIPCVIPSLPEKGLLHPSLSLSLIVLNGARRRALEEEDIKAFLGKKTRNRSLIVHKPFTFLNE